MPGWPNGLLSVAGQVNIVERDGETRIWTQKTKVYCLGNIYMKITNCFYILGECNYLWLKMYVMPSLPACFVKKRLISLDNHHILCKFIYEAETHKFFFVNYAFISFFFNCPLAWVQHLAKLVGRFGPNHRSCGPDILMFKACLTIQRPSQH